MVVPLLVIAAKTPNFVKSVTHNVDSKKEHDVTSVNFSDGIGRTIQSVEKLNERMFGRGWDIYTCVYFDRAGRPYKRVKPFGYMLSKAQSHLRYIENKPDEYLLRLANLYYDGSNRPGHPVPDAEDFAYSAMKYYDNEPGSRIYAQSAPGKAFSLESGNCTFYWYFGSAKNTGHGALDNDGFLKKEQLRKEVLDAIVLGGFEATHYLRVVRSPNNTYAQTLLDKFQNSVATCTDNGNQRIVSYIKVDSKGNVLKATPPDPGVGPRTHKYLTTGEVYETTSPDANKVYSHYDGAGRLQYTIRPIDRPDSAIYYCYDRFSRITEIRKVGLADIRYMKAEGGNYGRLLIKNLYDDVSGLFDYLHELENSRKVKYDIGKQVIKSRFSNTRNKLIGEFAFTEAGTHVVADLYSYTDHGAVLHHFVQVPFTTDVRYTFRYDIHDRLCDEFIVTSGAGGTRRKLEYDSQGRLAMVHVGDQANPLVEYDYYVTGELRNKKLGNSDVPENKVAYTYTIRNWMQSSGNDLSPSPGLGTGFYRTDLSYESGGLYDGSITGAAYRYGLPFGRKELHYDYTYNDVNMLTEAAVTNAVTLPEGGDQNDLFETFSYDMNARIEQKTRGKSDREKTYDYMYKDESNQLLRVDKQDKETGVDEIRNYITDKSGALIFDRNKRMAITRDWAGRPVLFSFFNKRLTDQEFYPILKNFRDNNGYSGDIVEAIKEAEGTFRVSYVMALYNAAGERVYKIEK